MSHGRISSKDRTQSHLASKGLLWLLGENHWGGEIGSGRETKVEAEERMLQRSRSQVMVVQISW